MTAQLSRVAGGRSPPARTATVSRTIRPRPVGRPAAGPNQAVAVAAVAPGACNVEPPCTRRWNSGRSTSWIRPSRATSANRV
ncbi:hypothetical protein [Micromonospora zhanjiangensis]